MKLLLVYYHYEVCAGRYYLDAFKRLGHDVRHIGQQMSVKDAWGLTNPVPEKFRHNPDSNFEDMRWDDWTPDLILVCDSQFAVEGYQHPFYKDIPHAVIAVDNHVRDYEQDHYVHYFMAHYHGPEMPVDPARKNMTWLPCGYDPVHFTPPQIPWNEREYDVCMIGVMYPRRQEVIQALRDAGLKVFAETGLLYDEYRAAYHNSRISLCCSANGDVAQRIFETGAMGCAVLTDPLLDLSDPETNRALGLAGYMVYTNPKEAVSGAKDLLGTGHDYFIVDKGVDTSLVAGVQSSLHMMETCKPHTWDARAKFIVDWFEREYGKDKGVKPTQVILPAGVSVEPSIVQAVIDSTEPTPKPYLNLGCGRTHYPSKPAPGHEVLPEEVYNYPNWLNVDKVEGVGADCTFDLFTYPWPLESNSFDGALLAHIVEHIPHEIKIAYDLYKDNGRAANPGEEMPNTKLANLQDGWYAFFAELYRVLTPGAFVHIIAPFAWSDGAITDPTHTRMLTPNSFVHGLAPEQYSGTFKYNADCNFVAEGKTCWLFSDLAKPFQQDEDMLLNALMTRVNMVNNFYMKLKAVK